MHAIEISVMYITGNATKLCVEISDLEKAEAGLEAFGDQLREELKNFSCIDARSGQWKAINLHEREWASITLKIIELEDK